MTTAAIPPPHDASPHVGRDRNLIGSFIDRSNGSAATFIGLVALLDVSCRCCCAISSPTSIPDAYDFGPLLLGILIFWGIAATSYRGTHITVDLLWANVAAHGSA